MNKEDKKYFLELLSVAVNKTSLEETEKIYHGLVKFIVKKLKEEGELKCPDFGTFVLSHIKPRVVTVPSTKKKKSVGGAYFVKFKPNYKVKNYLNNKK